MIVTLCVYVCMCVVPLVYEVMGVGGEVFFGWGHTGINEQVEAGIGLTQLHLHKQFLTEVHLVGEICDGVGEAAGVVKGNRGVKLTHSTDGGICDLLGFIDRLNNCVVPHHAPHLQQELSTDLVQWGLFCIDVIGVNNESVVDLWGEQ